jgi:MFS family permease
MRPSAKGIALVIKRWDVLVPSLLAAISQYVIWATAFGFTPIVAKQLGASDIAQSMLISGYLMVLIVGNLSVSFLVKRIRLQQLMLFSFAMLVVGVGLISIATSLPIVFGGQLLIGVAAGINLPILMGLSIHNIGESERNTAMGLHQSVYAIGMFAGPWLSGILASAIGLRWMLTLTTLATICIGLPITIQLDRIYRTDPSHEN